MRSTARNHPPVVFWLPLAWLALSGLNTLCPGDAWLGWVFGSFAGTWIMPLVRAAGIPPRLALLVALCMATGCAVMLGIGWLADRLRIRLWVLPALGLPIAALVVARVWANYGNLPSAIADNDGIPGLILPALTFGLTVAALLAVSGSAIAAAIRPRVSRSASSAR